VTIIIGHTDMNNPSWLKIDKSKMPDQSHRFQ